MNVLMVVSAQGFQDDEFREAFRAVDSAGHTVALASTHAGVCAGVRGARIDATLPLEAVRAAQFDAVVFVGGAGARALFDNAEAQRIASEMNRQHKVVAAIAWPLSFLRAPECSRAAASWFFATEVRELVRAKALGRSLRVVSDGRLITASRPTHAHERQ